MANYSVLKSAIEAVIKTNGNNEITGALLQQSLISMITSLGAHYDFVDVATPSTNPGMPDQNVMYFAATAGTYTNFGGIVVNEGEFCALCWNGSWTKKTTGAATAEQVTALGQEVGRQKISTTTTAGVDFTEKIYGDFKSGDIVFLSFHGYSNFSPGVNINVRDSGNNILFQILGDIIDIPISVLNDTDYIQIDRTANRVVSSGAVSIELRRNIAAEISEIRENLVGLNNLTQIIDSGKLVLEQGTITNSGGNSSSSSRIRCADAISTSVGFIGVPDGYEIYELFYYSAWTDANDFTLDSATIRVQSAGVTFDKTKTLVRFSIRKTDNTNFTLQDFLDALFLVSPHINKIEKSIGDILGGLQTGVISDYIVTIKEDIAPKVKSATIPTGAQVVGKNLFNPTSFRAQKILNDSGVEINDGGSSYFSWLIPCYGKTLISSKAMQRVYKYDADGVFLGRESSDTNRMTYTAPSNTHFVQIQVQDTKIRDGWYLMYEGSGSESYEPFYIGTNIPNSGAFSIFNTDGTEVSTTLEIYCKAIIPAVGTFPFWEPSTAPDNYKCTPLGQFSQSIPALNTLGYLGFLSTYFDNYIGKYSDGYEVKKFELGQDSGAAVEHAANPLFSYEFIPPYYNRTVLLSAGMNTCEASTYFGLAYFVKALMEHTEDGMLALYKTTRFVIIPVICPTGISHDPLLYRSANDVRINKNFSWTDSWQYNYDLGGQYPGPYPDSEVETKMLKEWLNKYNGATFYMDCHSDTGGQASQAHSLSVCFCSDNIIKNRLAATKDVILNFYVGKGYVTAEDATFVYNLAGKTYPKTPYAKDICGIPAIMHEQYPRSTAYGSDGATNNDSYGIKNYVALIRWYCLEMCKGPFEIVV